MIYFKRWINCEAKMRRFYLGVGAQKSATTWLFQQLIKSENYKPGFCKEYHIFDYFEHLEIHKNTRKNAHIRIKNFTNTYQKQHPIAINSNFQNRSEKTIETFYENIDNYYDYFDSILTDEASFSADISPGYSMLSAETLSNIHDNFEKRGIKLKVIFFMREPISRLESELRMKLRRDGALGKKSNTEMTTKIKQKLEAGELNYHGNYSYTCAQIDASIPNEDIFYGFYETLFLEEETNRLSKFTNIPPNSFDSNNKINKTMRPFHYKLKDINEFQGYANKQYKFVKDRFGFDLAIWNQELEKLSKKKKHRSSVAMPSFHKLRKALIAKLIRRLDD